MLMQVSHSMETKMVNLHVSFKSVAWVSLSHSSNAKIVVDKTRMVVSAASLSYGLFVFLFFSPCTEPAPNCDSQTGM